ncbi:N-acetylglucosamine-6-phosphate deacetylase [Pseudidiomarina mangrovi]|uniref:N-acetylglucosamine-6-phosphate deacetylase n=1 Tax=Pseudidiomarina mangrovi TaxID=2487133 RepID=UPI001F0BCADC|nr:N-acetylglucosamine-6-phosphate deacetylase [Pseudidiomarina mangrovi]
MFVCERVLTRDGWLYQQQITLSGRQILSIEPAPQDHQLPYYRGSLLPGFIDVQVNGGGGVLFNHDCSVDALQQIMQAHHQYGSTALLPTFITDDFSAMSRAAEAIIAARAQAVAGIVGVHFEGPWLFAGRKGVHRADYMRAPSAAELALLTQPELGVVMVTLAPEMVTTEVITQLAQAGIRVMLGHTDASAELANQAFAAGAVGCTHLFNAMSQLQGRSPGVVGACLANDSYAGIIIDGHHVAAEACRLAYKAKGAERLMLVTDAMALAATDADQCDLFGVTIRRQSDRLTTAEGTLAGSCLTMLAAVQNAVRLCGISLADAARMAATTPATLLGLDTHQGHLAAGLQADMVLLNDALQLQQVWQLGKPLYAEIKQ